MTVTLPDEMKSELEQGAKAEGMASVDEYVRIMYLRAKHAGDGLDDLSDHTPEEVEEFKRRLVELVRQGLNSGPAVPVTDEFWESLRQAAEGKSPARGAVA